MIENYKGLYVLLLLLYTSVFIFAGCENIDEVKVIRKPINSANDIIPINDSLVIPYIYTSAVSLKDLPVNEKKKKFFEMMLPAILVAKKELAYKLDKVINISSKPTITHEETLFIDELKEKYKAKNIEMLQSRLHTFPVCIVLAQAAIESGWGTSVFFVEANNPFGLWSFDPNQPRMKATGNNVYVRKFSNLEQAIDAYYTTLATAGPFTSFRSARLEINNPYELVNYLIDYSQRREAYVEEVKGIIRGNNLTKYDSYQIAPEYLIN